MNQLKQNKKTWSDLNIPFLAEFLEKDSVLHTQFKSFNQVNEVDLKAEHGALLYNSLHNLQEVIRKKHFLVQDEYAEFLGGAATYLKSSKDGSEYEKLLENNYTTSVKMIAKSTINVQYLLLACGEFDRRDMLEWFHINYGNFGSYLNRLFSRICRHDSKKSLQFIFDYFPKFELSECNLRKLVRTGALDIIKTRQEFKQFPCSSFMLQAVQSEDIPTIQYIIKTQVTPNPDCLKECIRYCCENNLLDITNILKQHYTHVIKNEQIRPYGPNPNEIWAY